METIHLLKRLNDKIVFTLNNQVKIKYYTVRYSLAIYSLNMIN